MTDQRKRILITSLPTVKGTVSGVLLIYTSVGPMISSSGVGCLSPRRKY